VLCPGGGVEAYLGKVGLRLDVGDEIYFNNGAQNNPKITFGPHFRFWGESACSKKPALR